MTHIIRAIYEILKHKKIITPNRISFVIIFTNMALLWTSWFMLCKADGSKIYLPELINYSGLLLVIIGLACFLTALFTIKTLESYTGGLITKGIYAKIRHPMYLGFILWLIGFPIFNEAVYSFFISLPFTANVLFWRHLEENELEDRFLDYKDYKKKTFFWK